MASDQESQGGGFGRVRVRFFGHSSMTFVDEGESESLLDRTASELRRLRPDTDWQCDTL